MGSALDSASLIMYPSGYSDGVLGSAKPTDGSGDFTFTRGSNLSATRVGPNGYIEKGYENLLYPSNDFSGWANINSILTPNQAGYDGSNDAWLLEATSAQGRRYKSISDTGVLTYSIYAKSGTANILRLRIDAATDMDLRVDLSDGSFVSGTFIDYNIEDAGNGWWRVSVTQNITSPVYIFVYSYDVGSIYIQDAMLNQGLVAYPYIETTTAPVAGGILEDEPRIDFSDGCGHLLLEPSRTNLITDSEYIIFQNGTEEYNSTISPEGVANATKIIEDSSLNGHRIFYNNIIPQNASAVNYTFSGFFKVNIDSPSVRNEIQIQFFADSVVYSSSSFNIASGTTTGSESTHRIDNYGNGWYRCSFTASVLQSTNTFSFARVNMGNGSSFFYEGDGVSSMFAYGLQLEQDATYPTSYIPTYGVSQTRLGDVCNDAGDVSTFNSTEGVLYAELSFADDNSFKFISLNSGISTNRVSFYSSSPSTISVNVRNTSGNQFNGNFSIDSTINHKIAVKYKENDFALWIDGQERLSDSSGTTFPPSTLTQLDYDDGNGNSPFNGIVKQMIVFPTALSDSECIALTTI